MACHRNRSAAGRGSSMRDNVFRASICFASSLGHRHGRRVASFNRATASFFRGHEAQLGSHLGFAESRNGVALGRPEEGERLLPGFIKPGGSNVRQGSGPSSRRRQLSSIRTQYQD